MIFTTPEDAGGVQIANIYYNGSAFCRLLKLWSGACSSNFMADLGKLRHLNATRLLQVLRIVLKTPFTRTAANTNTIQGRYPVEDKKSRCVIHFGDLFSAIWKMKYVEPRPLVKTRCNKYLHSKGLLPGTRITVSLVIKLTFLVDLFQFCLIFHREASR